MNPETAIMRNIRLAINKSGRARLLRNNVGFASKEKVAYGLGKGSADLLGALRGGHAFAIEVKLPHKTKSGDALLDPDQAAWWRAARQWGVLGGVATSIEDAMRLLADAERAVASRCAA